MNSVNRSTMIKLKPSRGFGLIEVLVSLVILVLGLLSLAGLQGKLMQSEMEAQQRTHAQMLAQDMVDRILAYNLSIVSACFASDTRILGTGFSSSSITCSLNSLAAQDIQSWDGLLKGASEQITVGGTVASRGAMIGARGCIKSLGGDAFRVSVAWQGLRETTVPSTALDCGKDQFGNEKQRRIFAVVVQL